VKIVRTRTFERQAGKLLTEIELIAAFTEIAADPLAWPVIQGTGGCRKARAARGGSGKSGGVRIIYFVWLGEDTIIMLMVYAKSRQEDLSASDKKALRQLVKDLQDS
jgi:hypothetical protein